MIRSPLKLTHRRRSTIAKELGELVGAANVDISMGTRLSYSGANVGPKALPDIVVKPRSVSDVQKILQFANKHSIPVTPVCSGTQESSTHPFFGGIVIDSMSMNSIIEINTDAAYAVVEPGVSIGQLATAAAEYGFRVTVGSFPPALSVIGNYTLVNVNTHRTTMRDDVLALEVVIPDGTIVKTGSKAFGETYPDTNWFSVWNSYPDLKYLFMDAYGTLGVITKAAIRLYQKNESAPLVVAAFDKYAQSLEFMRRVSRANLVQHVCTWHWVMYTIINHLQIYKQGGSSDVLIYDPWELPDDRPYNLVIPVMSGYKEDMEGHEKTVKRVAEELGGRIYNEELQKRFPGALQFFTEHFVEHIPSTTFMGGYGEAKPVFPIVIADPAKVDGLEAWALRYLRNSQLKLGLSYYSHSMDQNRGIFIRFTPFIPYGASEEEVKSARQTYWDVMETAFSKYGAIPCRNTMRENFFDPQESPTKKMGGYGHLLRLIKKAVDPNNIMNPGFGVTFFGTT